MTSYKTHKARTTYSLEVTRPDGATIDAELPFEPSGSMDYKEYLIKHEPDKIIIGYLADDPDCGNPLEDCDAIGQIYSSDRHARREQHEGMQKALGLDSYWNPDLSQFDEDDEDKALALWRQGRKAGTVGDKYVVSLDVYQHGGISYNVSGRGMQCEFDTARGGAVWVPDKYLRDELDQLPADEQQAKAREYAQQACEQYTAWCNGDCYGVVVVTCDAENGEEIDNDACWGFIGSDYAYQSLQSDYFPKEPQGSEA